MEFYRSFQNFPKQSFFPFFIVGVSGLRLVQYKFEPVIKNIFGLEMYRTVNPNKQAFTKFSSAYTVFSDRNFQNQLKNLPNNRIRLNFVKNDKNLVVVGPAICYKFSDLHTYSILLETFVKDFHVVSRLNLPYFQFFYFILQLEKDLGSELDFNSDFHSLRSDILDFCRSIYFIGFGMNLLVGYLDFKNFVNFVALYMGTISKITGANSIFIFNFIFNFVSKVFNMPLII